MDEVYTVGEDNHDDKENSSGNDSDRDQRRGRPEFYDAISDPADLTNALDPMSEQNKMDNSSDVNQTPVPPLFPGRETISSASTVPYNNQAQQTNQASTVQSRQMRQNVNATPVDKFLAIWTAFSAKLPAISLHKIKFKGSQQLLHSSKLPDNLHLPKDLQNVFEYKEWNTLAEA